MKIAETARRILRTATPRSTSHCSTTAPDNIASIRLLEKCGLRYQGAQTIAPYTTDSNVYLAALPMVTPAV